MKRPNDVGKDFDDYAEAWDADKYGMEVAYGPDGLVIDSAKQSEVVHAGDEWGEQNRLRELYQPLFERLLGAKAMATEGSINILEIGAGGGRSTEIVVEVLGSAIGDYHVVDVSAAFTKILAARVKRPVDIHVVDDVDLSAIATDSIHLCLAQSSWSHISLYDQYRYLRELRRVMKHGGPVVVSGMFLLGVGDDWTWNRFRRRVHQIDNGIEGVYHEVTSADAIAEMLIRLEYQIEVIAAHGFVARSRQRSVTANVAELAGAAPSYPVAAQLEDFAQGAPLRTVTR